jgi:hypothetical protein
MDAALNRNKFRLKNLSSIRFVQATVAYSPPLHAAFPFLSGLGHN